MSISDDLMWRYYELLSAKPLPEVRALQAAVAAGTSHPKQAKLELARELVTRFHDAAAGAAAMEAFEKRFAKKELDASNVPLVEVSLGGAATLPVVRAAAEAGLTQSATEARKLLVQGAVRVDGQKVADPKAELGAGEYLLQVGKLKAARIRLG